MRLLQALLVALCLYFPAVAAQADNATCEITVKGERVDGPCRFQPHRGGSFSIAMMDGRLMGGATSLSLDVLSAGVGEVRGLTAFGVRSRWGEARRMEQDRACWRGTDFTLCVRAAADQPPPSSTVFSGRCHMDVCTWVDQPPARQIGTGSGRIPGRRVETTVSLAQSEHLGGSYPDTLPEGLEWTAPQPAQFFCSTIRPAFLDADGSWMVLPLPEVFGATESVTRRYLRACHPGTEGRDPYRMPAVLGYSAGMPRQDLYPDFDSLIRG